MTIVTDFDIGEEVVLENGEAGKVTAIRVLVQAGKTNADYRVEYEVDHHFVRQSFQLRLA